MTFSSSSISAHYIIKGPTLVVSKHSSMRGLRAGSLFHG